jgi:hypothetical protein
MQNTPSDFSKIRRFMLDYSIGDSPDEDELSALLFDGEHQWATVYVANTKLRIKFHPEIHSELDFDANEFIGVLDRAIQRMCELNPDSQGSS